MLLTFNIHRHFTQVGIVNEIPETCKGAMDYNHHEVMAGLKTQCRYMEEEILEGYNEQPFMVNNVNMADAIGDILFIALGYLYKVDRFFVKTGTVFTMNEKMLKHLNPERLLHDVSMACYDASLSLEVEMSESAIENIMVIINRCVMLAWRLGYDIDAILDEICECNLTKFDTSLDQAVETKAKYAGLGVNVVIKQGTVNETLYYVVFVDGDQQANDKFWPNNKWLKSINFREPEHVLN